VTEFDHYRDSYEEKISHAIRFFGQPRDFYTKVKADYLMESLAPLLSSDRTAQVLDIGCGNGAIHRYLRRIAPSLRITGVDVAATVVEEARRLQPENSYDAYDGERLPYEPGAFDAAYAIAVMHHVPPTQWRSFLKEMCRVVRPGGTVIVFEHNPLNPLVRWIVKTCPFDRNAILLPSSRLVQLMQEVGLENVVHRFIVFTPFQSPPFRRLDRRLGSVPLGAQYFVAAQVPASC
jgi:SAM-dependent methyltransferase